MRKIKKLLFFYKIKVFFDDILRFQCYTSINGANTLFKKRKTRKGLLAKAEWRRLSGEGGLAKADWRRRRRKRERSEQTTKLLKF